jgi:hypothetical protein
VTKSYWFSFTISCALLALTHLDRLAIHRRSSRLLLNTDMFPLLRALWLDQFTECVIELPVFVLVGCEMLVLDLDLNIVQIVALLS